MSEQDKGKWQRVFEKKLTRRDLLRVGGTAGLSTLLLSACQGAPTTSAPTAGKEAPTGPVSAMTRDGILKAAKAFSGTKIGCGVFGNEAPAFEMVKEEFEKATGVQVELLSVPVTFSTEKLLIEFNSGRGTYDLAQFVPAWDKGAFSPFLADLDPYNSKYGFDEQAMLESLRPHLRYPSDGGKFVDLVLNGNMWMFYYRTDYFEKAGLDPNKPPATWDEFLEFGRKLNGKDLNGDGKPEFAYAPRMRRAWNWYWFFVRFAAWGGDWFEADWKPKINSPEAVAALEFSIRMKEIAPPNSLEIGWAHTIDLFKTGQVAMIDQHNNLATLFNDPKQSQAAGKFRNALLPAGPAGLRIPRFGSSALGIAQTSKNKDAAYLWARWMLEPENQKKIALAATTVDPIWKGVYEDSSFQSQYGDKLNTAKVMLEIHKNKIADCLSIPETPALYEKLDLKLSQAYAGEIPPKRALDECANEWTDFLKKAGYYKEGFPPYKVQV